MSKALIRNPLNVERITNLSSASVILVRHAESEFNKHFASFQANTHRNTTQSLSDKEIRNLHKFVKTRKDLIDSRITDYGKHQCTLAGLEIRNLPIKYVFVSPMRRTLETCRLILENKINSELNFHNNFNNINKNNYQIYENNKKNNNNIFTSFENKITNGAETKASNQKKSDFINQANTDAYINNTTLTAPEEWKQESQNNLTSVVSNTINYFKNKSNSISDFIWKIKLSIVLYSAQLGQILGIKLNNTSNITASKDIYPEINSTNNNFNSTKIINSFNNNNNNNDNIYDSRTKFITLKEFMASEKEDLKIIVHPFLFEKIEDSCDILGDIDKNKEEYSYYDWSLFNDLLKNDFSAMQFYQSKYCDMVAHERLAHGASLQNWDNFLVSDNVKQQSGRTALQKSFYFELIQAELLKKGVSDPEEVREIYHEVILNGMKRLFDEELEIESSFQTIERLKEFKKFLIEFMEQNKVKTENLHKEKTEKILIVGHSVIFQHFTSLYLNEEDFSPGPNEYKLNNCEFSGIQLNV